MANGESDMQPKLIKCEDGNVIRAFERQNRDMPNVRFPDADLLLVSDLEKMLSPKAQHYHLLNHLKEYFDHVTGEAIKKISGHGVKMRVVQWDVLTCLCREYCPHMTDWHFGVLAAEVQSIVERISQADRIAFDAEAWKAGREAMKATKQAYSPETKKPTANTESDAPKPEPVMESDAPKPDSVDIDLLAMILTDIKTFGGGFDTVFITFATDDGVRMSKKMFDSHPEKMTIALNDNFADLEVLDNGFHVTLLFNGEHQRLSVSFRAVKKLTVDARKDRWRDAQGVVLDMAVKAEAEGDRLLRLSQASHEFANTLKDSLPEELSSLVAERAVKLNTELRNRA